MKKNKKYTQTGLILAVMSVSVPSVFANETLQGAHSYEEVIPDLRAFSELVHQVRYFYPSEAVEHSDWDSFLRDSFKVLRDTSRDDRAEKGLELIQAIAPYVERNAALLPPVDSDDRVNSWIQSGASTNHIYYRYLAEGTFQELTQLPFYTKQTYYTTSYQGQAVHIPLHIPIDSPLQGTVYQAGNPYNLVTNMTGTETCMAAVSSMWAEIQHFWPYFDQVEVNWSQAHSPLLNACTGPKEEISLKVNEQFSLLRDNHMWISYPDELMPKNLYELPFRLSYIEDKALVVNRTDFLSLQVKLGDELVSINGQSVSDWLEYYKGRVFKTGRMEKEQTLDLLTRYSDSRLVDMTFRKPAGEQYNVTSATVHYEVTGEYKGQGSTPRYDELVRYHEGGVAQLMAYNVTLENLPQVKQLLEKASSIVIDFRHYPSSFQGWQRLFSWMLSTESRSCELDYRHQLQPDQSEILENVFRQTITPEGAGVGVPLVALSAHSSISQNEHALTFLQDAQVTIMGEPTSGINGDIKISRKFGGTSNGGVSFIYTGLRVNQINGDKFIGVGVLPDIYVPRTADAIKAQVDNQLNQAVDYLKSQL